MLDETNLESVKSIVEMLLYIKPLQTDVPFFVYHPIFTSSVVWDYKNDKQYNIVDSDEDFDALCKIYKKQIEESDLLRLYMTIRTPYKLTFLKYAEKYMSEEDFSNYFASTWVETENPNQDVNCSIAYLIKTFRKCNKKLLMTKEDYEIYNNLPEEVQVYRGIGVGRNPKGLSWTKSLEKAEWFAHRFDSATKEGYVLTATVPKTNILAYFNTRDEDELVCDTRKLQVNKL